MRLLVGIIILAVTALDARFGQNGAAIRIVGFVTGGLLALSVVVDLLLPEHPKRDEAAQRPQGEAGH
jgi:hypothetical protein